MNQHLIFDLDDTLLYCNRYFFAAAKKCSALLHRFLYNLPVTLEEISLKQEEIDLEGVHAHGFQSDHFAQSFVLTYRYYCHKFGRTIVPSEEKQLLECSRTVYEINPEPYPDMERTLSALATYGHELHLYTGGVAHNQLRKIHAHSLQDYFADRIHVRTRKNTEDMADVLRLAQVDLAHTWMIGNSLRTDIMPALQNGIHAIHFQTGEEWSFNVVDLSAIKAPGAYLTVRQLPEIQPSILTYLDQQS